MVIGFEIEIKDTRRVAQFEKKFYFIEIDTGNLNAISLTASFWAGLGAS